MKQSNRHVGFTLIEILVAVGILLMFTIVSVAIFKNMYEASVLRAGGSEVYEALTSARERTLSSEGGIMYGVHLSSSTVTRFDGPTYVVGNGTNKVYTFEGGV